MPLPFVHQSAPLYLAGLARPGPTMTENRAVHAMARLLLAGAIDHVQTSWVKLGVDGTRTMLAGGADDLGGTLMEETISRMAGSEHGSLKTVAELEEIARGAGRPVGAAHDDLRRGSARAPGAGPLGDRARCVPCPLPLVTPPLSPPTPVARRRAAASQTPRRARDERRSCQPAIRRHRPRPRPANRADVTYRDGRLGPHAGHDRSP